MSPDASTTLPEVLSMLDDATEVGLGWEQAYQGVYRARLPTGYVLFAATSSYCSVSLHDAFQRQAWRGTVSKGNPAFETVVRLRPKVQASAESPKLAPLLQELRRLAGRPG